MAKKNDSTQKKINSKIDAHDKQHTRNAKKRQKKVEKMFDEATKKASIIASATSGSKNSFELSKEPAAKKRIDEVIMQLNEDLSATIINGDKEEWLLSANKNDAMVDYLAQHTNLPSETISQWKSRNLDALEAFQQRKIEGMNLSAKVWNITDQFKGELEMAIDVALGDGVSAAAMSRTVRKLLNNPTALFRRVRDKNGQLRLSQNAKNYHPGRGVYRSAYRNALRLTATETNMAYRTADHTRWQQLNFVTGIEIKLSNNHNCRGIAKGQFYDICDELAGVYPKDFKFVGWHPFCRCFAVPKLADMDEFLKYQDKFVAGEDVSGYKFSGEITQMPKQFNEWVKNNEKRIKSAKSLPYFLRDNQSLINPKSYEAIYGHKAGGIIRIDEKLTAKVRNTLKNDVATLTKEQYENAKEVAEMVGASFGKPMRFEDVDSGNVNPKYGQSKKYEINCALSVLTSEARTRGINVYAEGVIEPKGKNKHITYQLGENMSMAWIDPKTMKNPTIVVHKINGKFDDAFAKIGELTKENGRYYLGFEGELDHALNIYRRNGKLYLYDQQINGSCDLLKLLEENNATSFEVLRLDNLLIDKTNIDQWIVAL